MRDGLRRARDLRRACADARRDRRDLRMADPAVTATAGDSAVTTARPSPPECATNVGGTSRSPFIPPSIAGALGADGVTGRATPVRAHRSVVAIGRASRLIALPRERGSMDGTQRKHPRVLGFLLRPGSETGT